MCGNTLVVVQFSGLMDDVEKARYKSAYNQLKAVRDKMSDIGKLLMLYALGEVDADGIDGGRAAPHELTKMVHGEVHADNIGINTEKMVGTKHDLPALCLMGMERANSIKEGLLVNG
ncbi:hypothetical protein LTR17_009585 [Elasticomyces elasticus]|nr:hypothetical protein LTR17_009585 [Elasticomyces elasticus]